MLAIIGFAEIAKPLHASTRGPQPLEWNMTKKRTLRKNLVSILALVLPNINKSFVHGYVRGITKGVLMKTLRPWGEKRHIW